MYERLHRIYIRMREEECTCQVFAAVAVDALCRSFETTVERIQGVSQLELLYAELTKEEQQKQLRREQKKLKRKRKKERLADQDGKENNCNQCENGTDFENKDDTDKDCTCSSTKLDKNNEPLICKNCDDLSASKSSNSCAIGKIYKNHSSENLSCNGNSTNDKGKCTDSKEKLNCSSSELWLDNCKCNHEKSNRKNSYKFNNYLPSSDYPRKENGSSSDHSHDCGYSSENNNGCCETGSLASSIPSSPEGSEMACSDGCCQLERDYNMPLSRFTYGNGQQLSLQEMLEVNCLNEINLITFYKLTKLFIFEI